MSSPSTVNQRLADAFSSDPRGALIAVRDLIGDDLPWLERRAEIGRALGRSRQAVRQRYRAIDGCVPPVPTRPLRDDERAMARWNAHLADIRRQREFESSEPMIAW